MDCCVIADFEWCVTPLASGNGKIVYYNELLSVGAVTLDESGVITDRFYSLIRPVTPRYVHPVLLTHLHLDRGELSGAPCFPEVYHRFLSFIGTLPVCTWGSADASALLQNLRIKGGENTAVTPPPMRDIQGILCRAAELHPPYPGLANTLTSLGISRSDIRHNALADAEATATILHFLTESGKLRPGQFARVQEKTAEIRTEEAAGANCVVSESVYASQEEAFLAAKRMRRYCPVCSAPIGVGVWINNAPDEKVTLCNCEKDGKLICSIKVLQTEENGLYHILQTVVPYNGAVKTQYNAARHSKKKKQSP